MADPVRDFKIDEDGEWVVSNGDFVKTSGQEAVEQSIRVSLGLFLGECYLDDSAGTDYLDSINIKNPDPLVVREILRQRIARVPDVTNVVGAQLVDDGGRQASIAYAYDSVYSEETLTDQADVP